MIQKLSKQIQIEILAATLIKIKKTRISGGLCWFLIEQLKKIGITVHDSNDISKYIDGFNITNARNLAVKYKFKHPRGFSSSFWWNDDYAWVFLDEWYEPRIAFLNALITELNQKITFKEVLNNDNQYGVFSSPEINILRRDFYEHDKPIDQTKKRLTQLVEMGMEEVGSAQFGIRDIMSGLYIEMVWSYNDEKWDDYINWVKELVVKKTK